MKNSRIYQLNRFVGLLFNDNILIGSLNQLLVKSLFLNLETDKIQSKYIKYFKGFSIFKLTTISEHNKQSYKL